MVVNFFEDFNVDCLGYVGFVYEYMLVSIFVGSGFKVNSKFFFFDLGFIFWGLNNL